MSWRNCVTMTETMAGKRRKSVLEQNGRRLNTELLFFVYLSLLFLNNFLSGLQLFAESVPLTVSLSLCVCDVTISLHTYTSLSLSHIHTQHTQLSAVLMWCDGLCGFVWCELSDWRLTDWCPDETHWHTERERGTPHKSSLPHWHCSLSVRDRDNPLPLKKSSGPWYSTYYC